MCWKQAADSYKYLWALAFPVATTMIRNIFFLIVALLCTPAFANDIAVAAPDGNSGWFLLENPVPAEGAGLSRFASDPGLPAPDALRWPHTKDKPLGDSSYPLTELWKYTDDMPGTWKRATRLLDHQAGSYRRTLHAVFLLNGTPHVLHYDPLTSLGGGYSQLIRVGDDAAEQTADSKALLAKLKKAVVLNSARGEIFDTPEPSPDGKHLALRFSKKIDGVWRPLVRIYETESWTLAAEHMAGPTSRFAWVDNQTLAYIAWDGDTQPAAPQADQVTEWRVRLFESHAPRNGVLKTAVLKDDQLVETDILDGEFPPDQYTRTLLADPDGLGLIVARKDGEAIVVELREPKPDGKATQVGTFILFRGCAVTPDGVIAAGVHKEKSSSVFRKIDLPRGEDAEPTIIDARHLSTDGHGGLIDLGHGVTGILEAIVNPAYDHETKRGQGQVLRHVLAVPRWPSCDSLRNPRVIQQVSKMVRRFAEIGDVRSTLLVFDIEIAAEKGKHEKNGRYVELYGSGGRKGQGRIRTEDNLGGNWIVQAVDGGGDKDTDDYYDCVGKDGQMRKRSANNAGKVYDDLITQLEARKLLTLTEVDKNAENGGLIFIRRDSIRDPASGATWRTWMFVKYGRVLDPRKQVALRKAIDKLREDRAKEGADLAAIDTELAAKELELANLPRERLVLHFVAELPHGSAGHWSYPHALAQVEMRFAMSNQREAAVTNLNFEPDSWIALPNVTDLLLKQDGGPDLLLPKVFRIYEFQKGKPVERLKAVAKVGREGIKHPEQFVKGGKLYPGYDVPKADFSKTQFIEKQR